MKRLYESALLQHSKYRQMAFLVGPRQVGKTTTCRTFKKKLSYYNWDNQNHQIKIIKGPDSIAEDLKLDQLRKETITVIFDEIHKYSKWKTFIKGFFDVYHNKVKIVVTGSSRLDVFKKGGDSLMGRYFLYRMHPLTVRELIDIKISDSELKKPKKINQNQFNNLLQFGGFPEPFIKKDIRFSNRWKNLRTQQLFNEDLRDLTRVQEIDQIQILAEILKEQVGQLTNYSNLSRKINVSVDTIRRWLKILESLYYCFSVRPWSVNVSKSLIKEPKFYLWDWSLVDNPGSRRENFIASHLLKFVHWLQDNGFGEYRLYFLRDKNKREIDFLVVKNKKPWFLIEVKSSKDKPLSKELKFFQLQTKAPYAFQVVFNMDYIDKDCFSSHNPLIIPAQTLLSQLV